MSDRSGDTAAEFNFDGIPGPTHNYAGLSVGNLASQAHVNEASNPRQAALQGLQKMKLLADLGVPQGVLPPQERPGVGALRRIGFGGSDANVLEEARRHLLLLAACGSASAMWAANAATVSPSADTGDGRVHFTPANLVTLFHRSLEPATTARVLKAIFADESAFAHHEALPASAHFADEGAANHTRLCNSLGQRGLEIFVYGREGFGAANPTMRFPARQTREASEAIARSHGLTGHDVLLIRQNPVAIDAGAFHCDVVAVGHRNVLIYHKAAFVNADWEERVRAWFETRELERPHLIGVSEEEVPLADAVLSYLFNSQIVDQPDGSMAMIAPIESSENPHTRAFLNNLLSRRTPIGQVQFADVRQSMHNGGGPACLRLRVVLDEREQQLVNRSVLLTDSLYMALRNWVERHYRERLLPADLGDPKLLDESRASLDELTRILRLGSVYPFQMA